MATTRTTVGSLVPHMTHGTLREDLAASLDDQVADFDVDGIVDDYLQALNAALPEGWMVHASAEITAPAGAVREHNDPRDVIADAVDTIDQDTYWDIVQRHEHS